MAPGHSLYAAVEEKLQQALHEARGQAALFVDPASDAPYRLHFFEMTIRGQTTGGATAQLHAELVAVREEERSNALDEQRYSAVPADALIDLAAPPASTGAPAGVGPRKSGRTT